MPNPKKRETFSSFSCLTGCLKGLLVLFMLFPGGPVAAQPDDRQPLTINMDEAGCLHLQVELAADPDTRKSGLMHRDHLPENAGMLFDYGHEQSVHMWMKNTLIPLDMLFIDNRGYIVHIVENTEPGTKTLIGSEQPVRAVLEINAGSVEEHGIQVGHRIQHPIFGTHAE